MNELFSFALLSFTSFFTLINPLGVMPVFLSMTADMKRQDRNRTVRRALGIAFLVIVLFAFMGELLFAFFGLSINSFRVVGGIIFLILGMDMLQARLAKVKVKESEITNYINDITVTPLAIPMLCGPGAITNSIVLMQSANTLLYKMVLLLSLMLVILVSYGILYSGSRLIRLLGQTGINVMMRIMGLILMVIAIEFLFSGITPIIISILQSSR